MKGLIINKPTPTEVPAVDVGAPVDLISSMDIPTVAVGPFTGFVSCANSQQPGQWENEKNFPALNNDPRNKQEDHSDCQITAGDS